MGFFFKILKNPKFKKIPIFFSLLRATKKWDFFSKFEKIQEFKKISKGAHRLRKTGEIFLPKYTSLKEREKREKFFQFILGEKIEENSATKETKIIFLPFFNAFKKSFFWEKKEERIAPPKKQKYFFPRFSTLLRKVLFGRKKRRE